jgi:autotransporter adhesin
MKNISQFFKDRWAATGWPMIAGGLAGGAAAFAVYMLAAVATGNAHAQTVNATTINANPGPLNIRVTGTQGRTSVVTIDDNAWVYANGVNLSKDLNASGAISGKSVTVGAEGLVVNGNAHLTQNVTVGGTLNASKLTGLDQGAVNATSKDAVNGAQLHTTNSNVTAVNARVDGVKDVTDSVTSNGTVAKANAAATQSGLNATNARVGTLETDKADRTAVAEDIATAKGDAIAVANGYTDSEIIRANSHADAGDQRTLSSANAYTDQQIGQVRKEVNAVGAMAMAASVVGGVSVAEGKSTAVTAAVGNYGNATAVAVGVTHIVAPNKRVFGTISRASGSKTGVGLGASFSF